MLRFFLKASVKKKTIFIDSWILVVSSFVFSFVLIFSSSMASALILVRKLFISPDITVNKSLTDECIKGIVGGNRDVICTDKVSSSFGILENRKNFTEVMLKKVDGSYFNRYRREVLKINGKAIPDDKEIIISKHAAELLGLKTGERVAFLDSSNLRGNLYTVCGIFSSGFSEFDAGTAFAKRTDEDCKVEFALRKESPELIRKLSSEVSPENVSFTSGDSQDIITSLNSIKFILLLFVLLSLCYSSAVIKNYEKRSASVFSLYEILGCPSVKRLKTIAVIYISFLSVMVGIFAGIVASFAAPHLLTFISRISSLDFGYYILSFKIEIPYFKLFLYTVANLLTVLVLSLIHKNTVNPT